MHRRRGTDINTTLFQPDLLQTDSFLTLKDLEVCLYLWIDPLQGYKIRI
ncbi:MAG: hypothetical protein IPP79_12715 [Chitinophagaceae bacterium]|nr:hypothetical protein [Chitinophagaceae bacterium]